MNKQDANKELTKLADLMEACDYQGANYKEYSKEYRRITKLLYPVFDKYIIKNTNHE